jgi:hypothetical protein
MATVIGEDVWHAASVTADMLNGDVVGDGAPNHGRH